MQLRLEKCLKGMKNKRDAERKQELYLKLLGNYDWNNQLIKQSNNCCKERIEKREKDRSLSNSRSWSKREASTRTDDTKARRMEGTVQGEGEELAEESFLSSRKCLHKKISPANTS